MPEIRTANSKRVETRSEWAPDVHDSSKYRGNALVAQDRLDRRCSRAHAERAGNSRLDFECKFGGGRVNLGSRHQHLYADPYQERLHDAPQCHGIISRN